MNRRNFLSTLIGGVAASAAVRTFPFRVFSFPKAVEPVRFYLPDPVPPSIDRAVWEYTEALRDQVRLLTGVPYWVDTPPTVGTFCGISREIKLLAPVPKAMTPGDILLTDF